MFSNNALVCPQVNNHAPFIDIDAGTRCMLFGVSNQEDADQHEQTGIYLNSASNHIIGNHVVGMVRDLVVC